MKLVIVSMLAAALIATEFTFHSQTEYAVGMEPRSICASDLDADGALDLLIPNHVSNDLSILRNNGDGTFGAAVQYPVGTNPFSACAADFSGDGSPDVAVANEYSNSVSILRNNGDGTLAAAESYPVAPGPWSVCAGDFNKDGKLDIALAGWGSSRVSVLFNSGFGSFAAAQYYEVGGGLRSICTADFDADGDSDLAVARYATEGIVILQNQGNGTFTVVTAYQVGANPWCVSPSDINGDGHVDLAVANEFSNSVSILMNTGTGTFEAAWNYGVQVDPIYVCAADLSGDGWPDLAVANHNSNSISLLLNDGSGNFGSPTNLGVGVRPWSVCAADLDKDGRPDLAVTNKDANSVSVLINETEWTPVLTQIGSRTVDEGTLLSFQVQATGQLSTLILTAVGLPGGASFTDLGGGKGLFEWTPGYQQAGAYNILFVVTAGQLSDSELVRVTVIDVTSIPMITELTIDGQSPAANVILNEPIFAWHYFNEEPLPQTHFEVGIGTDNDWTYSELWNPAPFNSSDTSVIYAGAPLLDGTRYYLRLRVSNGTLWSDWYQTSFRMNSVPSVPALAAPIGDHVAGATPTLWLHNATDAEGDSLTYDFVGFHDTDCVAGPTIELLNVPSGADSTGGQILAPLAENCRYWWCARAFDGYEYGAWTTYGNFFVDGTPEPPSAFTLSTPPDSAGLPLFNMLPTMRWQTSFDPDPYDTVRYKLELSPRQNFSFAYVRDSLLTTAFTLTDSLDFATHYWWRVTARDRTGLTVTSPVLDFWTWTLGDINHDHTCDIGDLSRLVDFLFFGAEITPHLVGDFSGDCAVDISDLQRMIDYLFFAGQAPKVGC